MQGTESCPAVLRALVRRLIDADGRVQELRQRDRLTHKPHRAEGGVVIAPDAAAIKNQHALEQAVGQVLRLLEDLRQLALPPTVPADLRARYHVAVAKLGAKRAQVDFDQAACELSVIAEAWRDAVAQPEEQDNSLSAVISRLRQQMQKGERFSSQRKLAKKLGCSSGSIANAVCADDELRAWSLDKEKKALKAISLDKPITGATETPDAIAEGREAEQREKQLRDDPAAMNEALQRLKSQICEDFSGNERAQMLDCLDPQPNVDRARLIVLLEQQVEDSRTNRIEQKERL